MHRQVGRAKDLSAPLYCSCPVSTICATCNVISSLKFVLYFYINTFRSMCAVSNTAPFFFSSLIACFPVCFLVIVWVTVKWLQWPLFLLVPLLLQHSACAKFLIQGFYILKFSQLHSWSHFCLQELKHLLTFMFFFIITDYDIWFIVMSSSVCYYYYFHEVLNWLPYVLY